jgi:hypothetical protein
MRLETDGFFWQVFADNEFDLPNQKICGKSAAYYRRYDGTKNWMFNGSRGRSSGKKRIYMQSIVYQVA